MTCMESQVLQLHPVALHSSRLCLSCARHRALQSPGRFSPQIRNLLRLWFFSGPCVWVSFQWELPHYVRWEEKGSWCITKSCPDALSQSDHEAGLGVFKAIFGLPVWLKAGLQHKIFLQKILHCKNSSSSSPACLPQQQPDPLPSRAEHLNLYK